MPYPLGIVYANILQEPWSGEPRRSSRRHSWSAQEAHGVHLPLGILCRSTPVAIQMYPEVKKKLQQSRDPVSTLGYWRWSSRSPSRTTTNGRPLNYWRNKTSAMPRGSTLVFSWRQAQAGHEPSLHHCWMGGFFRHCVTRFTTPNHGISHFSCHWRNQHWN